MSDLAVRFGEFANSLGRGYIKPWKAYGMIDTLTQSPDILTEGYRLLNYVEGCLLMEGFDYSGCETLAIWLLCEMEGVNV